MSPTIDANVLLYASDTSSEYNARAERFLRDWAAGPDLVYLFWPTVLAYLRISTHPRVFDAPLPPATAAANASSLLGLVHLRTGSEDDSFWDTYRSATAGVTVAGNLVSDAHLVALMRQHGVNEIWSPDRDFRKFEGVRIRDPFASR